MFERLCLDIKEKKLRKIIQKKENIKNYIFLLLCLNEEKNEKKKSENIFFSYLIVKKNEKKNSFN